MWPRYDGVGDPRCACRMCREIRGESFDRTLVWCAAVIALGTIGGLGLIAWIVAMVAR